MQDFLVSFRNAAIWTVLPLPPEAPEEEASVLHTSGWCLEGQGDFVGIFINICKPYAPHSGPSFAITY